MPIEVKATIVGLSPGILMDSMSKETLLSLYSGVRKPHPKGEIPPEETARRKIYVSEEGEPGVPAECLFASLVNAGRKVKNGKAQISTANETTLPALLEIREDFLVFNGYADKKWETFLHPGRLEQNNTAVCIVRPLFRKWGFDVTLEIDDSEVSEETIKQLFAVAGKKYGLCSWRPQCKGKFGRFRIEKWVSKKV